MNIYLKLPRMVAEYLRNSLNPPLAKDAPMKLSPASYEGHLLRHAMRSTDTRPSGTESTKPPLFYTQDEWVLLSCGTSTRTLKTTVHRNPKIYPTYMEVRSIEGYPRGQRSDNYDYLCIQLPRTRFDGRRERPINIDNPVYLGGQHLTILCSTFKEMFYAAVGKWYLDNRLYCLRDYSSDKMIDRQLTDIIYRFFEAYDITVSKDEIELATVRKMMSRILRTLKRPSSDYPFDITYTDSNESVIIK